MSSSAQRLATALAGGLLACFVPQLSAQDKPQTPAPRVVIVSPSVPKDSRGETVYTIRGEDQADQPAVPGTLVDPVLLGMPALKYPKALKKAHRDADVEVLCVITANGDVIDAMVKQPADEDASKSALDAARRARFKPATLDGKPVALRTRIVVHFNTI